MKPNITERCKKNVKEDCDSQAIINKFVLNSKIFPLFLYQITNSNEKNMIVLLDLALRSLKSVRTRDPSQFLAVSGTFDNKLKHPQF